MGTKAGIVYGTKSGIPRRLIVPDSDSELNDPAHVKPGESILIVGRSDLPFPVPDLGIIRSFIRDKTGIDPPTGRCVCVDENGVVQHKIMADPEIDSVDGHTLHLHDHADLGWKHLGEGKFVPPGG